MNEWKALQFAEKIIFELDSEKITQSIQAIIGIYDKNYPYSFNLIISQMIYLSFVKQKDDFDTYLNIIKEIETLEETNKSSSKILDVFTQFLLHKNSQESYYLLETLVLQNLIDSSVLKNKKDPYFAHHMSKKDLNNLARYQIVKKFFENIDELSKDDWKLHKQLIQERGNTSNITKAIRNDNIQILQEISTQNNFDLNKIIELSLYEINSFVVNNKITLIDYAAFFGSVKCFKYLLMNGANVNNTGKYAIAGGNEEIIHLCEQNHSVFKDSYEIAIEFHRNDIFKYVYENKIEDIPKLEELGKKCVLYHNYEIFTFLQDEGMQITSDIINESAKIGNLYLIKYFLEDNQPSKDILVFSCESRNIEVVQYVLTKEGIDVNAKDDGGNTALMKASEKGYTEIVKLLLEQKGIDINAKDRWGNTALIRASANGQTEIVKLLLEQKGIDINAKNRNFGDTASIFAIRNGHSEILKLFLEQEGFDVNACDDNGETLLMIAVENNHINIVKILLEQENIDVNMCNKYGQTALHFALNNIEIMKLLLKQKGINVNVHDHGGESLLMLASYDNENVDIVKLLLDHEGFDVNLSNAKMALKRASFSKKIVQLIQNKIQASKEK